MQKWYYLEDYKNAMLRRQQGILEVSTTETAITEYMTKRWLFRVLVRNVHPGEVVCVTGNTSELGSWQPDEAIELDYEGNDIWSKYVDITDNVAIQYRYCVAVVISDEERIIRTFENNFLPRMIAETATKTAQDPEVYGGSLASPIICRGWLTREAVVYFKLSKHALRIYRMKYINRKIMIKVTPVNVVLKGSEIFRGLSEALDESLSGDNQDGIEVPEHAITEVAVLNKMDFKFERQNQFGKEYSDNEMLIFQSSVLDLESTGYLIDFYINSTKASDDEPPFHAGFSYILPSAFRASEGSLIVPITSSKQRPLGETHIEYVIVKPMQNATCDFENTDLLHWNRGHKGLDVGHRGAGNSYKDEIQSCAEVRENTIASMKTAIDAGADFVEFDVQLSKDGIPIIYHDFTACISLKRKRHIQEDDLLEIPIKDLTLEQLRLLKVYHRSEAKSRILKYFDEELEEHQPFPTLQQCFEALSPHTGFNIEIKWTMQLLDGTYELYHPTDLNLYIDTILEVVLKYSGERPIIFSCFNPDVCTAIRLKQNRYPVMFLTQGATTRWDKYKDERSWNIENAVYFAKMNEILGINVHTEDILREPNYVKMACDANLVIFCWGDDNANQATLKYLKDLGLHGIIYDKIDENSIKEVKESIFLVEARESQKRLLRIASEKAEVIPGPQPTTIEPMAVLNVDSLQNPQFESNSTATSLFSLESELSETQQQERELKENA